MYREILGPDAAKHQGSMRKDEYLGLITHLDTAIGAVLERLKDHGLEDNTLVIFTSDNGGGDTGPLRGGKTQMFEGGHRVPMIARWPGHIPKGTVHDDLTTTLEFFPTFLAAAGAPPPAVKLDGFNLLPTLEGKAPCPRQEMFWESMNGRGARFQQWKWVDSKTGGGLFDLSKDLGEKHDLSESEPKMRKEMEARWTAWKKEMDASEPRGPFRDY